MIIVYMMIMKYAVKVIQQPNCLQCKIEEQGNRIAVEVEREFDVKVIGETKVNVKVDPTRFNHAMGNTVSKRTKLEMKK